MHGQNLAVTFGKVPSAVSTLSTCNMVIINGVNTGMGRRLAKQDITLYQMFSGSTSITSSSLNSGIAELEGHLIRKIIN